MKFKRNLVMYLKNSEVITVPDDEFWRYTVLKGVNSRNGLLSSSGSSIPGNYANAYSVGGTNLKTETEICITGAAFTAD